ncbi:MAG: hypothetical protein CM15mP21_1840 [Hyphomicrobiales bacterium]|nr:MAG: hypothetical protein CM15mP21_1840 [Hyphomicrobiales bacterium]
MRRMNWRLHWCSCRVWLNTGCFNLCNRAVLAGADSLTELGRFMSFDYDLFVIGAE